MGMVIQKNDVASLRKPASPNRGSRSEGVSQRIAQRLDHGRDKPEGESHE